MKRIKVSNLIYQTLFFGCSFLFICFFIWSEFGLLKHYEMNKELHSCKQRFCALKKEVKLLEQEIVNVKNDSFYIEKMAREDLGMGYKGEILYQFTSADGADRQLSNELKALRS